MFGPTLEKRLANRQKLFFGKYPQVAVFAHDHIGNAINTRGRYELNELNALAALVFPKLKNKRICLDIGANIGNHSLAFAEVFQNVIAFEPNVQTYKLLKFNSELVTNITPVNIGASDIHDTVDAIVETSNYGAATTDRKIANELLGRSNSKVVKVKFELKKIDDCLSEEQMGKVDLIKIDVEGHELRAFDGLTKIITKSEPMIVFEVLKSDFKDGKSASVQKLMMMGYSKFYVLKDKSFAKSLPRFMRKPFLSAREFFTGKYDKNLVFEESNALPFGNHNIVVACKANMI